MIVSFSFIAKIEKKYHFLIECSVWLSRTDRIAILLMLILMLMLMFVSTI